MKFGRLTIRNFLTIGEAGINLADRGLVAVQGENEDDSSATSNGAGKSSMADALCWALYGKTARGEGGDAVVNRTAGKDCHVTVNIKDGDDGYLITRYRKHKEKKNALEVWRVDPKEKDWIHLTKGTEKLTQEVIDKILGCSYDVFRAAVYAGQEQMPDLPSLTDKQLKVIVEEAAGITVLEAAYELAKTDQRTIEMRIAAAELAVSTAENDVLMRRSKIETEKLALDHWEEERRRASDKLKGEIRDLIGQKEAVEKRLKELDRPSVEKERAACYEALDAVAKERTEETRLATIVATHDRNVALQRSEAASLKKLAEQKQHAIKHIDGKIGEPCGECLKPYEAADIAPARAKAIEALREIIEAFSTKKLEMESAKERAQSAADALEAHRRSMTDVSATSALASTLDAFLRDIERLEEQLRNITKNGAEKIKALKELGSRINPHVERLAEFKKELAAYERVLEEKKHRHALELGALELSNEAVKVFGPAGVRAQILDLVTPFLNDRTAQYLGTLSDGNISATWSTLSRTAKGELREKFKIEVTHAKGGSSFGLISGGEKRKVRIACALALQDLVASRAAKPIELFIGDEIDDALDPAGLERLMAVLEEKARERGTVIIISHNALTDWIRQVVTVRKKDGQSSLSEAA